MSVFRFSVSAAAAGAALVASMGFPTAARAGYLSAYTFYQSTAPAFDQSGASTYGTGPVSASVSGYDTGLLNIADTGSSGSATADYLYLRASASQQIAGVDGYQTGWRGVSSTAYSENVLRLTDLDPSATGQTGVAHFALNVDGTVGAEGFGDYLTYYDVDASLRVIAAGPGIDARWGYYEPLNISEHYDNYFKYHSTSGGYDGSFDSNGNVQYYGLSISQIAGRYVLDIPYKSDQPFTLAMTARCSSYDYAILGTGFAQTACDLSHTVLWGGFLGATGSDGKPVNLSVTSENGVNYMQAFHEPGGVPEPAAWATMILGFFGMGGALRRRGARAAT